MALELEIYDLFWKVPLFKDLNVEELKPIVEMAKTKKYIAGHHVFFQGDDIQNVYFIYTGKVKIYKTDVNGREQIVNIMQFGNMFPHAGFFRQDMYPAHAEMIEDGTVIYVPILEFEQFLIRNPRVCVKVFRVLGDKIVDLQQRLEEKVLHNTYEQIIMLLLRLIKMHGIKQEDGKVKLNTHFTNREFANMIGSSRETVSRTTAKLKKANMVEVNAYGHLLLDEKLLLDQLDY